ncbi:hypothetical protein ykris0001_39420 [Yersinia kristensenii ATCC 33638]|nr:hypothetical protein ykris0001_39420 [Yersinia kristensenii ATCC 33638]
MIFLFDEVNVVAEQLAALQLSAAMDDTPAPIYQRVKLAIMRQIRTGVWQPTSASRRRVSLLPN